jgi:hypothetical protein
MLYKTKKQDLILQLIAKENPSLILTFFLSFLSKQALVQNVCN